MTDHGLHVDLYWLPLGAGGHSVRFNGKVYEALVAGLEHRSRCDLYHSALVVQVREGTFVVEQGPAQRNPEQRGVVSAGSVGSRYAGRFRLFRYELRCWSGGAIPDVADAVDSPQRVTDDPVVTRRVLELAPAVPAQVWGRDELDTGEMWNSNSAIAWLLEIAGVDAGAIHPPTGGRAPGWHAGVVVASVARDPE
jgi:hypothetical protein